MAIEAGFLSSILFEIKRTDWYTTAGGIHLHAGITSSSLSRGSFPTSELETNYPDGVITEVSVMAIPTRLGHIVTCPDRVATHVQLLVSQVAV